MSYIETWIVQRTHVYKRHGGKTARKAMVRRLVNAANDISLHEKGVTSPSQIGRRHIHEWYQRHSNLAEATLRDYGYAFELLWVLLERSGSPPKPNN